MIEYNEALQNTMNDLISYSNAHGVYRDKKIVNGITTDQDCLVVLVSQKLSPDRLNDNEIIPKQISDIPTDIIEAPIAEFMSLPCTVSPRNKIRPLKAGISAMILGGSACTLGAIVKDTTDNNIVGLTNNHCAGDLYDPAYGVLPGGSTNTTGFQAAQPSPWDPCGNSFGCPPVPGDIFGFVKRAVKTKVVSAVNRVDGAIYELDAQADIGMLNIVDQPLLFETNVDSYVGQSVKKNGRTTCATTGTIADTNAMVSVGVGNGIALIYQNQILVTGSGFVNGGDSGSTALTQNNRIIGLIFAGNRLDRAWLCRIDRVAQELQIKPWQGDIVVANNTSPTITVNGRLYTRYENTTDPITHEIQ